MNTKNFGVLILKIVFCNIFHCFIFRFWKIEYLEVAGSTKRNEKVATMATETEMDGIRFDFLFFFVFSPSWSSSLSGVSSMQVGAVALLALHIIGLPPPLNPPNSPLSPPHHLRTNITSILTSGATKTASGLQSQRASGIHGKVLDSKLQLLEKYCNMHFKFLKVNSPYSEHESYWMGKPNININERHRLKRKSCFHDFTTEGRNSVTDFLQEILNIESKTRENQT